MREANTYDLFLLILLALIWGSSFFNIKIATYSYDPITLALVRVIFASIPLLILCKVNTSNSNGSTEANFRSRHRFVHSWKITQNAWNELHNLYNMIFFAARSYICVCRDTWKCLGSHISIEKSAENLGEMFSSTTGVPNSMNSLLSELFRKCGGVFL